GELEGLPAAVPLGVELRAPFLHADGPHLLEHSELLHQGQVGRQQRLPDMEAGVASLLQYGDTVAELRKRDRRARASGAPANDDYIRLVRPVRHPSVFL